MVTSEIKTVPTLTEVDYTVLSANEEMWHFQHLCPKKPKLHFSHVL